jgi:hypothetical protein
VAPEVRAAALSAVQQYGAKVHYKGILAGEYFREPADQRPPPSQGQAVVELKTVKAPADAHIPQGHSVLLPKTTSIAAWRYSAKCSNPSTGLKPRRRSSASAVLRTAASTCGAWPALVRD